MSNIITFISHYLNLKYTHIVTGGGDGVNIPVMDSKPPVNNVNSNNNTSDNNNNNVGDTADSNYNVNSDNNTSDNSNNNVGDTADNNYNVNNKRECFS